MTAESGVRERRLVALIPAAGAGTRLGTSGSKEALCLHPGGLPVISHALGCAERAGAAQACVVLREGKQDIQDAVGSVWNSAGPPGGEAPRWSLPVEYLVTDPTPSAVHTLAAAQAETASSDVLLAFPDILFQPASVARDLVRKYHSSDADVALALFPGERPDKADMVELDAQGRPVSIVIKEAGCDLRFTWGLAIWGPRFSDLLQEVVADQDRGPQGAPAEGGELFVGDLFKLALEREFRFEAVCCPNGFIIDVGTPGDLERARQIPWPTL